MTDKPICQRCSYDKFDGGCCEQCGAFYLHSTQEPEQTAMDSLQRQLDIVTRERDLLLVGWIASNNELPEPGVLVEFTIPRHYETTRVYRGNFTGGYWQYSYLDGKIGLETKNTYWRYFIRKQK